MAKFQCYEQLWLVFICIHFGFWGIVTYLHYQDGKSVALESSPRDDIVEVTALSN